MTRGDLPRGSPKVWQPHWNKKVVLGHEKPKEGTGETCHRDCANRSLDKGALKDPSKYCANRRKKGRDGCSYFSRYKPE